MLQLDLCDYSDAYIAIDRSTTVTDPNDANYKKELAFQNIAPFISCISKINNTLIDSAEDLDTVMPLYNSIEYSKNYSKTKGILWNYMIIKQVLQENQKVTIQKKKKLQLLCHQNS